MFSKAWDWIKKTLIPSIEDKIEALVINELQPVLTTVISENKSKIIAELQNFSAVDNSKKFCEWLTSWLQHRTRG